jgi:hypothetical protein
LFMSTGICIRTVSPNVLSARSAATTTLYCILLFATRGTLWMLQEIVSLLCIIKTSCPTRRYGNSFSLTVNCNSCLSVPITENSGVPGCTSCHGVTKICHKTPRTEDQIVSFASCLIAS